MLQIEEKIMFCYLYKYKPGDIKIQYIHTQMSMSVPMAQ